MTIDAERNSRGAAWERRSLELVIRGAEAEERMLERRLQRVAAGQQRARQAIESELRHEHFGRMPQ